MPRIVVDASILGSQFFPGQFDQRIGEFLASDANEFFAPTLLYYEITNSALQLARRGIFENDEASSIVRALGQLRIRFLSASSWNARAFEIATEFGQRATYDAIYLACAEDVGAELWTRDRRFVESFGARRPGALRLFPEDVA